MNAEPGKEVDASGAAFHPSGHPDSSVDLDLLADYSCGVLDHAHSEMVAARIATDPAWAAAYRQLAEADAAVQADLAALRMPPAAIPADVAARIDAALAAAAPPVSAPPVSPAPAAPISLAARRRRMRVAAVAAVAATVVAIAGVAVGVVVNQTATERGTAASEPGVAREQDNGAPEQPRPTQAPTRPSAQSDQNEVAPPARANPVIRRSGRNYTAATLTRVLDPPSPSATPNPSQTRHTPRAAPAPLPRELKRLDERDERMRCLRAVRDRYGAYPTVVDYARYEGDAALIMVLPPGSGGSRSRILVVGPNCGVSGTDARYLQK